MVMHGAKRKTLALAVAGALLGTGFIVAPEAKAEGFIDDSSLTGGIYYWQRQRDRKDLTPGVRSTASMSLTCITRLLMPIWISLPVMRLTYLVLIWQLSAQLK